MLNSPVLEVAIGMVLFYLLLSLISSALNELIESWWKNRARDLESGIRRMLDDELKDPPSFFRNLGEKMVRFFQILSLKKVDPVLKSSTGLAGKIYDHALVRGLYLDQKDLPSYIPARNFALALMDLIAPGGATGAMTAAPGTGKAALEDLKKAISDKDRVPSDRVRDALAAIIDASGDDPAAVRKNIEDWYNSTMDRVAGWYKRRTQVIILAVGFLVAIATNADSVIVVDALWHNSDLRSGVVQAALDLNQKQQASQGAQTPSNPSVGAVSAQQRQLSSLGLPIGWHAADPQHTLPTGIRSSLRQLYFHWLGWLITGLAISLGAPFWFDLLNKIIVVRSTVKPQEKSPDEPAKG